MGESLCPNLQMAIICALPPIAWKVQLVTVRTPQPMLSRKFARQATFKCLTINVVNLSDPPIAMTSLLRQHIHQQLLQQNHQGVILSRTPALTTGLTDGQLEDRASTLRSTKPNSIPVLSQFWLRTGHQVGRESSKTCLTFWQTTNMR